MKGIILAGGTGTRLYPATMALSKQLITVYNKPMVYYSLSILQLSGITEILIIATKFDAPAYKKLFGTGESLGLSIKYAIQDKPGGIAEALIIGESFINKDNVCLVLGDNIIYGAELNKILLSSTKLENGALIFAYKVDNPSSYGVIDFDDDGRVTSIIEKPNNPTSNYAALGIYYYDNKAVEYTKLLKPSKKGELEITDLNNIYLQKSLLKVNVLPKNIAWFDAGTHESLLNASNYVRMNFVVNKVNIGCIEEISYKMGYISKSQLLSFAKNYSNSSYGKYLMEVLEDE